MFQVSVQKHYCRAGRTAWIRLHQFHRSPFRRLVTHYQVLDIAWPTPPPFSLISTRTHSTHTRLFDTLGILRPQWWHLSPCFGAALQSSAFKSNLLRLANSINETERIEKESSSSTTAKASHKGPFKSITSPLERPCKLMQCLFFQPQPGAPVRLTKSKSMAAAYLTPQIMGTLMGAALLCETNMSENEFSRILLDRHGIKSNHVNGAWTGVSFARWKEIVSYLKLTRNVNRTTAANSENGESVKLEGLLTAAVWSMAVWECCKSKQSYLDYLLSVQEVSGRDILNPSNSFVQNGIQRDSAIQSAWATMDCGFGGDSTNSVQPWLEGLLPLLLTDDPTANYNGRTTSMDTARAIEKLCTSIVNQQQSENVKPTTPNGYYGFDGGQVKPDCVEVAIRELIDYLLWDDNEGQFDVSRLPPSSSAEIVSFYKTHSALEGGEQWFQILSDIPGCLYLSASPSGRPYELTPTLRNVAKVCRRLLYNNGSGSGPIKDNEDWESLSRLQDDWEPQDVHFSFDIFSEKAKMSPDIHVHEVATVTRIGKKNAIEMRLRCDWNRNTGFATVTHLRLTKEKIDEELLNKLLESILRMQASLVDSDAAILLAIPILADFGVLQDQKCRNLLELVITLLSCRYGIDRRELLHITATSDLEREEAAFLKARRDSERVLSSATIKVCQFLGEHHEQQNQNSGVQLLNWLLSESCQLDHSNRNMSAPKPDMEFALLNLPDAVKFSECTKRRITHNWAVRGHLLQSILDWKSGKESLLNAVTKLKLRDWARFFLLNRRIR